MKTSDRNTNAKTVPWSDEYDAIVERLSILHPSLDEDQIRLVVADAAGRFAEDRLSQLAPLLVENAARDACRKLAEPEEPDLERASHSEAVKEIHD